MSYGSEHSCYVQNFFFTSVWSNAQDQSLAEADEHHDRNLTWYSRASLSGSASISHSNSWARSQVYPFLIWMAGINN